MRQCAIGLATSAGMSMNSVMVDVYPVGASSYLGGSRDSRLRRDRAARAAKRARWLASRPFAAAAFADGHRAPDLDQGVAPARDHLVTSAMPMSAPLPRR